jgi:hypothetical protein
LLETSLYILGYFIGAVRQIKICISQAKISYFIGAARQIKICENKVKE